VRRCGSAGRPCRWPTLALLATLLLLAQAAGVRAQIPYLDPIPWVKTTAKIGQEAVLFNLDRFWDTRTDWTANRLGVTGLLRAGRSGMFYFRVWYVAFDSGDLPVLERWPDVRGTDAEPDWPGEARSVGLGRPQLGAVGQFSIYGLGKWWYGLGVGLPIGRDQLYPMSAASIPVQLDVRKSLDLSAAVQLALYGGPIWHFPSSRDKLSEEAFPNGFHGAADLQWVLGERRTLTGGVDVADFQGRTAVRLRLRYWLPIGSDDAFGVEAAWELGNTENRSTEAVVSIFWRFNRRAAVAEDQSEPLTAPKPPPTDRGS